jgi:radical SAM superfamily enzyme YgiQ (UPF0313 family)
MFMKTLLVYPRFPSSFWSFEKFLKLVGRKVLLPPLGLITVASLLPTDWELKLVDQNVRPISNDEWDWADMLIISAMIVQKEDFACLIEEANRRGISVAVGGPYPTSLPDEAKATGAHYLILDEGEITIPLFVDALGRGETSGTYTAQGEKPDVTRTPIPRYDLLDLDAYQYMAIQFSRGCPFQCEFCDIIVLYGRKPRTKTPDQVLCELNYLRQLGWDRYVFMVDDNFIGNKRNVKVLLGELKKWQQTNGYPFRFFTEASIDLADDPDLMELMVDSGFNSVFLGIETSDEESLIVTKKFQNTRQPLNESVDKIIRAGIIPMAGFILGFDGEKAGAGNRIADFVDQVGISIAFFTLLQALPNTALWHRLQRENRLLEGAANINQTTLMNFIPTRDISEIVREYIQAFQKLYEPSNYLDRTYHCFMKLGEPKAQASGRMSWLAYRLLLMVMWRQGVKRNTRWRFWRYLWNIKMHNPCVLVDYLIWCADFEHFYDYRDIVAQELEAQLKNNNHSIPEVRKDQSAAYQPA